MFEKVGGCDSIIYAKRVALAIEKVGQDLPISKSRWSGDVLAIIEEFVGPLTKATTPTIGTSCGEPTSFGILHSRAKLIKGSN
jgi:hypothetical protein